MFQKKNPRTIWTFRAVWTRESHSHQVKKPLLDIRRFFLCLKGPGLYLYYYRAGPAFSHLSSKEHSVQGHRVRAGQRPRLLSGSWSSRAALLLVGSSFPKSQSDLGSPRQLDRTRNRPGGVARWRGVASQSGRPIEPEGVPGRAPRGRARARPIPGGRRANAGPGGPGRSAGRGDNGPVPGASRGSSLKGK